MILTNGDGPPAGGLKKSKMLKYGFQAINFMTNVGGATNI